MFNVTDKSNSVISTIGTAIALLLALNLGILLKSHFLIDSQVLTKIITYFIVFSGGIIYTVYYTIKNLDDPTDEYIEGVIIGTGTASAIIMYIPAVLFTPIAQYLAAGTLPASGVSAKLTISLQFFILFYLIGIGLTAIFAALIVRGSELYARDASDKFESDPQENEKNEGEIGELFEEMEDADWEEPSEDEDTTTKTDTSQDNEPSKDKNE